MPVAGSQASVVQALLSFGLLTTVEVDADPVHPAPLVTVTV